MKQNKILLMLLVVFIFISGVAYFFDGKNNNTDVTKKNATFSVVSYQGKPTSNGTKVNFADFKGVREIYTLTMNKGDTINIKYKSNGLKMAVLDDKYKIVKDFNVNQDNDYDLKCTNSGKYYIRVYGNKSSGNFELEFNNKDNVKVEKSDFWK